MTQDTLPNGMRRLTASDGMMIIYRDDLSTATRTVYLGSGDSPSNYSEVTETAVEEWRMQHEAEMAASMAASE